MQNAEQKLSLVITANVQDAVAGAKKIQNEIDNVAAKKVTVDVSGAKSAFASLRDNMAMLGLSIDTVVNNFNRITDVFKSFIAPATEVEALRLRLQGLYGDVEMAANAFAKFEAVAKKTPATLQQVTQAGATLKAFGLDAENTIEMAVDLSSYMGMDLVEAASAMGRAFQGGVGASEIFRERGVIALIKSFSGIDDLTELTLPEFRSVMLETFRSTEAGIVGSSARIANSLKGATSNLEDTIYRFKTALGNTLLPAITETVRWIDGFVKALSELSGWVRTSLVLLPLATAAWYKYTVAQIAAFQATGLVVTASGTLTAAIGTMIASIRTFMVTIGPVGWALMALSAGMAIFAITSDKAKKSVEDAESAQSGFKVVMKTAAETATAESKEMDILGKKLLELKAKSKLTATEKTQMSNTIGQLNSKYGEYLTNINLETASYDKLKEALAGANKELIDKMTYQAYQDVLFEQVKALASAKVALAEELNKQLNVRVPSTQDNFMKVAFDHLKALEGRFSDWSTNPTYMAIRGLYDQVKAESEALADATNEYNNVVGTMKGSTIVTKGEGGGEDLAGAKQRYIDMVMQLNDTEVQATRRKYNEMRAEGLLYFEASSEEHKKYAKEISIAELAEVKNKISAMIVMNQSETEAIQAAYDKQLSMLNAYHEAGLISEYQYTDAMLAINNQRSEGLSAINQMIADDAQKAHLAMVDSTVAMLGEITIAYSEYEMLRIQQIQAQAAEYQKAGVQQVFIEQWVANQKKAILSEYDAAMKENAQVQASEVQKMMDSMAESIGGSWQNDISNMFGDIITGAKSASDAWSDMWGSMVKTLARAVAQMIVKLAMLAFWQAITGTAPAGGASPVSLLGGNGGDFFGGSSAPGGNILSTGGSNNASVSTQNNMIGNTTLSLSSRMDRLITAIENNQPQVYTQVIEGVALHKAVKRAEMQVNAL